MQSPLLRHGLGSQSFLSGKSTSNFYSTNFCIHILKTISHKDLLYSAAKKLQVNRNLFLYRKSQFLFTYLYDISPPPSLGGKYTENCSLCQYRSPDLNTDCVHSHWCLKHNAILSYCVSRFLKSRVKLNNITNQLECSHKTLKQIFNNHKLFYIHASLSMALSLKNP